MTINNKYVTEDKGFENINALFLHRRKDGLFYKKHAKKPFTGIGEFFLEHGAVQVNCKDGKIEGLVEGFHETNKENVCEADLRGANLEGADLRGANLYHATLVGACLFDAKLFRADLSGADLRGANFEIENLYGANLEGAGLDTTILTSGYVDLTTNNTRQIEMTWGEVNDDGLWEWFREKGQLKLRRIYKKVKSLATTDKNP